LSAGWASSTSRRPPEERARRDLARQRDAHRAAQGLVVRVQLGLGGLEVGEHPGDASVQHRRLVGQRDAASRANEQAHAERRLQPLDPLTDRVGGEPKAPSGRGEAASVGDGDEGAQLVERVDGHHQ